MNLFFLINKLATSRGGGGNKLKMIFSVGVSMYSEMVTSYW